MKENYAQPDLPEGVAVDVVRKCYWFGSYLCSSDEGYSLNSLKEVTLSGSVAHLTEIIKSAPAGRAWLPHAGYRRLLLPRYAGGVAGARWASSSQSHSAPTSKSHVLLGTFHACREVRMHLHRQYLNPLRQLLGELGQAGVLLQ